MQIPTSAVVRCLLYAFVCITSIIVSGVVGTIAYDQFAPGCLLSTEISRLDVAACTPATDCLSTPCTSGYECVDRKCVPTYGCFAIKGSDDTTPCKYTVVTSVVSSLTAMLFLALNLYHLLQGRVDYFVVSYRTTVLGGLALVWVVLAIAYSALITATINGLCKSLPGDCDPSDIKYGGGLGELPTFYSKLRTALVCGWFSMAGWFLIAAQAFFRRFCAGAESSDEKAPLLTTPAPAAPAAAAAT
eukprot:m.24248 g.24248  ORF g.24248 m.24248 type:complete len:245 (+) comp3989_c0_seq1:1242-1976(+)